MAPDKLAQIADLASDVGDILASLRVMAGAQICGNATIEGTNIDRLARQADRMIETIMEIAQQEQRAPRHAPATVAREPARKPDAGDLRLDVEDGRNAIEEILCGTRALRELLAHPWKPEAAAGLQGAALWSVGNVESDAENALAAIEGAARALGIVEAAA